MNTPNVPPLPDLLEKAIRNLAITCRHSDDWKVCAASAESLRREIKAYAIAAIQAQGVPDGFGCAWRDKKASVVQQEPVAWKHDCAALLTNDVELWIDACPHCGKPRSSQQAKPQPLSEREIWDNGAIMTVNADARLPFDLIERFVRAIEAAHGIVKE